MAVLDLGDLRLNYRDEGPRDGPALLFIHALGTGLALWDQVVALLPAGVRAVRYDLRGHGETSVLPAPYSMGALIRDAERLLEALALRDVVVIGSAIGGMVAQGLAVKRPDLVRALVLASTATKFATPAIWAERVAQVSAGGLDAVADATMARWFPRGFRDSAAAAPWRAMLTATAPEGYIGCCQAMAGTDFYTPTAGLELPVLVIAGADDGATPPDLVRELAELIPGATFSLLRGTGHLPAADAPAAFAAALAGFLDRLGAGALCGCGGDHPPHRHGARPGHDHGHGHPSGHRH